MSSTNASPTASLVSAGGGGGGGGCIGFASAKMFADAVDAASPPLVITAGALLARAARSVTFGDALHVLTPGLTSLHAMLSAFLQAVADNVVLPPRLLALLCGGDASIKCVTIYATVWSDGRVTNVDLCERGTALVNCLAARGDLPLQLLHVGIHQLTPPSSGTMLQSSDAPRTCLPPCNLIAGHLTWRRIDEDVLFRCRVSERDSNVTRYAYDVGSRGRSAADLQAWLDRLTADAQSDAIAAGVSAGARYHFVYRGHALSPPSRLYFDNSMNKMEPRFAKSVLAGNGVRCFDSLARVYHPHVARLRRDLALLDDDAHFALHGGRRKKGYLFSGPPGCCKTATVAAMAAETGRHILEVPWSRIATNADLEDLMSLRCIDGVHFHPRQLLVFFDEIDGGGDLFESAAAAADAKDKAPPAVVVMVQQQQLGKSGGGGMAASPLAVPLDKLHVGAVLACFDGVANHDGLVIVAATNHPEKLPAAMKRAGRLTHLAFDYMRPEDAVAMARDYFVITETEAQQLAAAVGGARLSGATLRDLCERSDDARGLIAEIEAELAAAMGVWEGVVSPEQEEEKKKKRETA